MVNHDIPLYFIVHISVNKYKTENLVTINLQPSHRRKIKIKVIHVICFIISIWLIVTFLCLRG